MLRRDNEFEFHAGHAGSIALSRIAATPAGCTA